jgi:hypothetical protein
MNIHPLDGETTHDVHNKKKTGGKRIIAAKAVGDYKRYPI